MTDLHETTEAVIAVVKETEEYKKYIWALRKLKEYPELFNRVNELREKNYLLHRNDSEDMIDWLDALTNEFDDVINNESVSEFLQAESSLCRLMSELSTSIVRGLEFD